MFRLMYSNEPVTEKIMKKKLRTKKQPMSEETVV